MTGREWYALQLKKPQWLTKRREIYMRDGYACVDCGKRGVTIECHHTHYVRGRYPWDYPDYALVTVCADCHERRHKARILVHDSHQDAEMWFLFTDLEAALLKEELKERSERIDDLLRRGAVWENGGRFYGLVDEDGHEWFFDEDGKSM